MAVHQRRRQPCRPDLSLAHRPILDEEAGTNHDDDDDDRPIPNHNPNPNNQGVTLKQILFMLAAFGGGGRHFGNMSSWEPKLPINLRPFIPYVISAEPVSMTTTFSSNPDMIIPGRWNVSLNVKNRGNSTMLEFYKPEVEIQHKQKTIAKAKIPMFKQCACENRNVHGLNKTLLGGMSDGGDLFFKPSDFPPRIDVIFTAIVVEYNGKTNKKIMYKVWSRCSNVEVDVVGPTTADAVVGPTTARSKDSGWDLVPPDFHEGSGVKSRSRYCWSMEYAYIKSEHYNNDVIQQAVDDWLSKEDS